MSNNEENKIWMWQNISSNVNNDDPNFWNFLENYFIDYGSVGFSEIRKDIRSFYFFGHSNPVQIRWTIYRSESLELLAVHGCYINEAAHQQPFILMVNPNHQRKGIGTMMTNYARERYIQERGFDMDADITFSNVKATPSGASFINKYVNEDYTKRNQQTQQ